VPQTYPGISSGVLEDGLVIPGTRGPRKGLTLSPLRAQKKLMLDDLDKEMTRRVIDFLPYEADCNIYVAASAPATASCLGEPIPDTKLRLKVTEAKSAVARRRSVSSWLYLSNYGS